MQRCALLLCVFLALAGCEEVDLRQAADAGRDALKALTLTDAQVRRLSERAAARADREHRIAPPGSGEARRLALLVRDHRTAAGRSFSFKVYQASTVNAFALADGSIRIYSGLMDLMSDQELLFVIGHEIGHVVQGHAREKMTLALAGSALRKGVAAQENLVGELAESAVGAFLQRFVEARFSQEEEKEADDYGLAFMQRKGYQAERAVSALEKLGGLGSGHAFLASHPEPEARAERLRAQLQGREAPDADGGLAQRLMRLLQGLLGWLAELPGKLMDLLPGQEQGASGGLTA